MNSLSALKGYGYKTNPDYIALKRMFRNRLATTPKYVYIWVTDDELAYIKLTVDLAQWRINDRELQKRIETSSKQLANYTKEQI